MPAGLEAREDGALAFSADVARQDDRDVAEPQLEHDRVLVAHALALPVGRRRMQHAQFDGAEALDVAGLHACAS